MADSFFEARIEVLEDELERTKQQLDIAVKALKQYTEAKYMYLKAQDGTEIRLVNTKFYVIEKALKEIEELNEIHK